MLICIFFFAVHTMWSKFDVNEANVACICSICTANVLHTDTAARWVVAKNNCSREESRKRVCREVSISKCVSVRAYRENGKPKSEAGNLKTSFGFYAEFPWWEEREFCKYLRCSQWNLARFVVIYLHHLHVLVIFNKHVKIPYRSTFVCSTFLMPRIFIQLR